MTWSDEVTQAKEYADELAAGDEVEAVERAVNSLDRAVRQLNPTDAAKAPTGHIIVPPEQKALALPAGQATINFEDGTVRHEKLRSPVTTDLVTITDISKRFSKEKLQLRNLLYYADTNATVRVGNMNGQELSLDYTPIPTSPFSTVTVELERPGNLLAIASTKPMNVGLGTMAVVATRVGETSGTLDSWTPVPVSPYDLYDDHGGTYADDTVATERYTAATWTIANQSGNGNEIDIQVQGASADPAKYASAEWRELERITNVPDGDHGLIEVTQEHAYMRARVRNATNGNTVDTKVELTEGTP